MGGAARARALTFDWDRILEGLLASYREVPAGHRMAPAAAGRRRFSPLPDWLGSRAAP